ncbi:MAG: YSC84-related protein [Synoicihabitans sp.]
MTRRFPFVLCLAVALLGAPFTLAAKTKAEKKQEKILEMREEVLATLYEQSPRYKRTLQNAEGYAVFSNVGVNLIFASFAGGRGVVEDKNGELTYMKMASAGLGFGLGVKDFRGIFIFHDEDKLKFFIEKGWDFSAQADAAAKSDEKGGQYAAAMNVFEGVEVIQITENGLALQATLQGTKYWRDKDLNYKK